MVKKSLIPDSIKQRLEEVKLNSKVNYEDFLKLEKRVVHLETMGTSRR